MAIEDDISITGTNIRHVSGSTVYSGLAFHQWLQSIAMLPSPVGDDTMSMVQKIPTELEGKRNALRPALLNMKNSYNIDDDLAEYLNFCSIVQGIADAEQYTGLKSQGGIVAASPVYVMQSAAKLTTFWADGHIQILVKAKTGGAFIDSGLVDVASRKYGQSYSWATVDLAPGGEQIAVVVTDTSAWQTMSEGDCAAAVASLAFDYTPADYDMGNGNGLQHYLGKITVSGGLTAPQVAQVLHYMCREDSSSTFNSVEGWRYRKLDAGYSADDKFPFGAVIAGVWYAARGWFVDGLASNYVLIDDNGITQSPPVNSGIAIGNLVAGDVLLVGRYDAGTDYVDKAEYTLDGLHSIGAGTVVINEAIKADTPASGTIRLGDYGYAYSSFDAGTKTFTLTGTLAEEHLNNADTWVPFIDKTATGAIESVIFLYSSDFTAYVENRNGNGTPPTKEFINTLSITVGTASLNVVRTPE